MDEGTFDEARNAPVYGALTQVGAPAAQSRPADTRSVVPGLQSSLEQQNKLIDDFYNPRIKMYEDLTAKIAARRAGPLLSERLAQLSAALAQPTKYSGPGNMFGAISSVYADQQKAQREERLANEDLATKYKMALMGEQESRFDKRISAADKLRALQMRYNRPGGNVQISGGVGFDKASGIPLVIPPMRAILDLQANPTPENMAEFDGDFGRGAAQRVMLYGSQQQDEEE